MTDVRHAPARLVATALLVMAMAGCSSSPGSGEAPSPTQSVPVATSPAPTSTPARTDWYGADPQELAAALGATGYTAKPKDTTTPYDYRSGSAQFQGVTVDIATFATAKSQQQNTQLQQQGAGSLPPGTSLAYAKGPGGQVTQQLGADGLTEAFAAQSKKTAEAAAAMLPGFTVLLLASTQK